MIIEKECLGLICFMFYLFDFSRRSCSCDTQDVIAIQRTTENIVRVIYFSSQNTRHNQQEAPEQYPFIHFLEKDNSV